MLIVNADDWGRDPAATDTALDCFRPGRITSATAMVFMRDSSRAADLAQAAGLTVGLHLNFTELFNSPDCPASVVADQARIRRFLKRNRYALLLYHPFLGGCFRRVVQAQLAEYRRLYGREPSHFDGHQHMHLSTNMLVGRCLPAGGKVRRSFSLAWGQKSPCNLLYRRGVDWYLQRRHRLTDYFFALSQHLELDALARVFALAKTAQVELMTHTWNLPEYTCLRSEGYQRLCQGVTLGSYANLP